MVVFLILLLKITAQGGGIRSVIAQGSLVPVSEVYDVFSNRDLLLTSQGQPKAKEKGL